MSILNPKITAFLTGIGYLVKLLSNLYNFERKKPWKYKQLQELRPDHSCL